MCSFHTPDRPTNPPDDDRFKKCIVCNGEGRVIIWPDPEDEEDGAFPDTEKCTACDGEGVVECDDHDIDW